MFGKIHCFVQAATVTVILTVTPAHATKPSFHPPTQAAQAVDLVIALDVSSSMSGLIESAKQRLWDVVNEMSRAQPQPDLRLAILTYGNPSYGEEGGYVRIDLPFTRDLDAVMQTLFSFGTNGGDEYVASAIQTSVNNLDWSSHPNAMKILFVAGNEGAEQDPRISMIQATQAAAARGIVVNTIYCGSEGDEIVAGWRNVAAMTNGLFASIDQNAAAVANIATPMDAELARLNQALNETYLSYGEHGGRYKENQVAQDRNAADMSLPSAASRAVAKAGKLYRNQAWDLVDARESGIAIEELEDEDLPEPMRDMSGAERQAFVADLAGKRESIAGEIDALAEKRQRYIEAERARRTADAGTGLDEAILDGIREIAGKRGFAFE